MRWVQRNEVRVGFNSFFNSVTCFPPFHGVLRYVMCMYYLLSTWDGFQNPYFYIKNNLCTFVKFGCHPSLHLWVHWLQYKLCLADCTQPAKYVVNAMRNSLQRGLRLAVGPEAAVGTQGRSHCPHLTQQCSSPGVQCTSRCALNSCVPHGLWMQWFWPKPYKGREFIFTPILSGVCCPAWNKPPVVL